MRIPGKKQKKAVRFLTIFGFAAVVFLFIYLPFKEVSSEVKKVRLLLKPAKEALLLQDLSKLSVSLKEVDSELSRLDSAYGKLFYFRIIPFLGTYYTDGRHLVRAVRDSLSSAEIFLGTITPYSAKLGFKGGNVEEPIVGGQERIAGLAKVAPVLSENYDRIGEGLHAARQELESVDPSRYPRKFSGQEIRSRLELFKSVVTSLDSANGDLKNLLSELPLLLGEPKRSSYLILFQNDKEIRPTGGFLTAYAVFTLEKGRIVSVTSGDMYFLDIDNRVPFYPSAPAVIQTYLKIKDWYIRDANLSPDYVRSAKTVEEFWNRVPGVPSIDGIIALDTHFVESLIGVLGDVEIPGYEKFTKDNITYQLELYATVIGSRLEKRGSRKDLIGVLMQNLLQKAFSQSAKQYGNLLGDVWNEASAKHLLFYFHSGAAQKLAEKYNFSGRILEASGDYLAVNDANFAGRKANWYVVENVTKKVEKEGGKFISTVTIDYENTGDYNADFNTGYRDYVRILVPRGSTFLSAEGSVNEIVQLEDLGKTVFAAYVAVDSKQKTRLTVRYQLPEGVIKDGKYSLLVQKQPGTAGFSYKVQFGRRSEDFKLVGDRLINGNL